MSCWSSTNESKSVVHSKDAGEDREGAKLIKGRGTRSMSRAVVRNLSNSWRVKERLKGVGFVSREDIVVWRRGMHINIILTCTRLPRSAKVKSGLICLNPN